MGIKNIMKPNKRKFNKGIKGEQYRNLVLEGGGVRGIAYMGALEVLDELGVLKRIERVAGTSAGAIAATIISFRKNAAEIIEIFNTLDLQKVPQGAADGESKSIAHLIHSENYIRLFEKFGWYTSEYFHHWLQSIIADQCRGNAEATFSDFQELGFCDLHIVVSNISRHRAEVFSADNTPDVSVADAVRMSMSIPLFFEALCFDGKKFGTGDYYADGGVFNNYPVHIFDHPEYAKRSKFYENGVNLETLGLFLFPSKIFDTENADEPEHLWEYLNLIVRSLNDSYQKSGLKENVADKQRTIEISDCGISSTQFDLSPDSKGYQQLFTEGRRAAEKFFGVEKQKCK